MLHRVDWRFASHSQSHLLSLTGAERDTVCAATLTEVKDLRRESRDLKEVVAEQAVDLRLLKRSMLGPSRDIAERCPVGQWDMTGICRVASRRLAIAAPNRHGFGTAFPSRCKKSDLSPLELAVHYH